MGIHEPVSSSPGVESGGVESFHLAGPCFCIPCRESSPHVVPTGHGALHFSVRCWFPSCISVVELDQTDLLWWLYPSTTSWCRIAPVRTACTEPFCPLAASGCSTLPPLSALASAPFLSACGLTLSLADVYLAPDLLMGRILGLPALSAPTPTALGKVVAGRRLIFSVYSASCLPDQIFAWRVPSTPTPGGYSRPTSYLLCVF